MRTMTGLRDAERAAAVAQESLRQLAFAIGNDDLLEIAQSLISVETVIREIAGQLASIAESVSAFDRRRDLADLDEVLVGLRRILALPDPGMLKITGWSSRPARPA